MGDVVGFSGLTKLDTNPDDVLDGAKEKLEMCVVIGWHKDGDLWFAASSSEAAEISYLLDLAKAEVMSWSKESDG